jgi:hypothetical protein
MSTTGARHRHQWRTTCGGGESTISKVVLMKKRSQKGRAPKTPSANATSERRDGAGISNRSPVEEERERARLPERGGRTRE